MLVCSTASLLRGFVVILYDKAVLEPNFIGMYAQMCERLAKVFFCCGAC